MLVVARTNTRANCAPCRAPSTGLFDIAPLARTGFSPRSFQSHRHHIRSTLGIRHRHAREARAIRFPGGLAANFGFADRRAVDEPSEGRRAPERLQGQGTIRGTGREAKVDARPVGRERDLERPRLRCSEAPRRVQAEGGVTAVEDQRLSRPSTRLSEPESALDAAPKPFECVEKDRRRLRAR